MTTTLDNFVGISTRRAPDYSQGEVGFETRLLVGGVSVLSKRWYVSEESLIFRPESEHYARAKMEGAMVRDFGLRLKELMA